MLFDPEVISKFADCGVTFLDSPEDVIQLALAYLHRDPNSPRRGSQGGRSGGHGGAALHPHLRLERILASAGDEGGLPLDRLVERLLGCAGASARGRHRRTSRFHAAQEGSNITYNAMLIPASAPHPEAAHKFLNFILDPKVIAEITNDIDYGNDNVGARPYVRKDILDDPAVYPPPEIRARLYCPPSSAPTTTGCAPGCGPASRPGSSAGGDAAKRPNGPRGRRAKLNRLR